MMLKFFIHLLLSGKNDREKCYGSITGTKKGFSMNTGKQISGYLEE
jgi:hypothetical protein